MKITLYKNRAERNRIDKSNFLDFVQVLDGTLKENISISQPYIVVGINGDIVTKINYAYIDEFKRYYYIEDLTIMEGNRIGLSLSVDHLHSFKDFIKKQKGVVSRTKTLGVNKYLVNNEIPVTSKVETVKVDAKWTVGSGAINSEFDISSTYVLVSM